MKKTVLKVVGKSKRRPLKHARKKEILEDKFENMQGSIVLGWNGPVSEVPPPARK